MQKTVASPPNEPFDFYHDDVKWWSYAQLQMAARRRGIDLSISRLRALGYAGVYECGRAAGAPSKKTPVHRISAEVWLAGGAKYHPNKKRRYARLKT